MDKKNNKVYVLKVPAVDYTGSKTEAQVVAGNPKSDASHPFAHQMKQLASKGIQIDQGIVEAATKIWDIAKSNNESFAELFKYALEHQKDQVDLEVTKNNHMNSLKGPQTSDKEVNK
jgi:hypothetical protein